MFKVATGEMLWQKWNEYPDLFAEPVFKSSLKPAGHAFALDYVAKYKPLRVLEIGHGANPMSLPLIAKSAECWGIDADDVDKTVDKANLEQMRADFPEITFKDGYVGEAHEILPDGYFDLVYSVSVIEHVPHTSLPKFHEDVFRILKPGGAHIHSYDVPWGFDYTPMTLAVEGAGFEWLEPQSEWNIPWVEHLRPKDVSLTKLIAQTVFEHPRMVLDIYAHKTPRGQRRLWNWTTIFMGARKPAS